jgi:ribosomal protein S6--L-glutamate ligase
MIYSIIFFIFKFYPVHHPKYACSQRSSFHKFFLAMNIVILSRSQELYSTQALVRAARRGGHQIKVLDHMRVDISLADHQNKLFYHRQEVRGVQGVIPRIGASATNYGVLVIRHFIQQGIYSALQPEALLRARNKFACLQVLSKHGVPIPKTIISAAGISGREIFDILGAPPYIIKRLESTHGNGVMKINSVPNAAALLGQFIQANKRIIIQKFIKESKGEDIRVFIVGNEIVACMRRVPAPGEFRSNLHRGGVGFKVKLSDEEKKVSLNAAHFMGLSIAGVDLLRSAKGPKVLEVNASPGLEGIESVTRVDVAGKIIEFMEREIQ